MRFTISLAVFLVVTSVAAQDLKSYDQKIQGTTVSFKMVAIPAGKFQIGSKNPMADNDETPQKDVELSSFWMGEHEVTFAEWDMYFKDNALPQSKTIDGVTRATPQYIDLTWGMGRAGEQPTNSMSQQAAVMYCKWLYTKTGFFFRLPTEAEWEYACKAGTNSAPDLKEVSEAGWSKENSGAKFHPVKQKKPNAWGLYDMLGNLSEWTIDQYDPASYKNISAKDPVTTPGAKYPRTTRGGSYLDDATQLRCSNRIPSDTKWNQRDPQIPKSRWWLTDGMFVGIRVVRPVKQPSVEEIEAFYNTYLK
ncbi:MAG TPA: SUMF1/EgtB/PvdO family nonheme iron enzyme [Cyclobacteriaceae bacterium]|nr:SUMF1/EgtB/PvdO family nonheme iron enzyme [Cyclobacteriaceae bacterium]